MVICGMYGKFKVETMIIGMNVNACIVENIKKDKNGKDFYEFFKVTREDMSFLWELFIEFGMNGGSMVETKDRTKGNHYFLQALCQYHSVEWKHWHKRMTSHVKSIIAEKYPQFMVHNKTFEK